MSDSDKIELLWRKLYDLGALHFWIVQTLFSRIETIKIDKSDTSEKWTENLGATTKIQQVKRYALWYMKCSIIYMGCLGSKNYFWCVSMSQIEWNGFISWDRRVELYREIIETVCMYFHIYERSQSEINETKRDKIHIFELSMSTLIIAQLLFFYYTLKLFGNVLECVVAEIG